MTCSYLDGCVSVNRIPKKACAELPENDKPESRHHETWHNSARIHQRMEQQNVDDQRPSDGQRQRNGSWKEKQRARDQLQPKHKHQVVRCRHDREVLLGQLGWRRRLRNEMQKTVQAKDDENERQQISRDGRNNLHRVLLFATSAFGHEAGAPGCQHRPANNVVYE